MDARETNTIQFLLLLGEPWSLWFFSTTSRSVGPPITSGSNTQPERLLFNSTEGLERSIEWSSKGLEGPASDTSLALASPTLILPRSPQARYQTPTMMMSNPRKGQTNRASSLIWTMSVPCRCRSTACRWITRSYLNNSTCSLNNSSCSLKNRTCKHRWWATKLSSLQPISPLSRPCMISFLNSSWCSSRQIWSLVSKTSSQPKTLTIKKLPKYLT